MKEGKKLGSKEGMNEGKEILKNDNRKEQKDVKDKRMTTDGGKRDKE